MKKQKVKKYLSFACIFLGILLLIYPAVNDFYTKYRQQKMIAGWKQNFMDLEEESKKEENKKEESGRQTESETGEFLLNGEASEIAGSGQDEKDNRINTNEEILYDDMEGILKIDRINLELPILTDATPQNLKISPASILNTGKPGETGNYAIAGHRSKTYGKNFNRLDEVEVHDIIQVITENGEYRYEVTDKFRVQPDEVWVLESNGKDKEITLITCDPLNNPYQRLVVKGLLMENGE